MHTRHVEYRSCLLCSKLIARGTSCSSCFHSFSKPARHSAKLSLTLEGEGPPLLCTMRIHLHGDCAGLLAIQSRYARSKQQSSTSTKLKDTPHRGPSHETRKFRDGDSDVSAQSHLTISLLGFECLNRRIFKIELSGELLLNIFANIRGPLK